MSYPVSPKAQAAGVSAAVAGALLYILQTYVFKNAVPAGVESLIYAATPGVVALAAAWLAPHQPRPGDSGGGGGGEIASRYPTSNVTVTSRQVGPPAEERLVIPGDPPPRKPDPPGPSGL